MLKMKLTASLLALITAGTGFMPAINQVKPDQLHVLPAVCEGAWQEPEGWFASFATPDGNGWIASGSKWQEGKKYAIVFDDMGTKSIYDDRIITILPCNL